MQSQAKEACTASDQRVMASPACHWPGSADTCAHHSRHTTLCVYDANDGSEMCESGGLPERRKDPQTSQFMRLCGHTLKQRMRALG